MFDDWFVHESLLPQLDLIMPGWEGLSDQQETGTRSPKSKKDIVIELLQETVESLVIDRDSRIAHVDQLKNDADLMVDGYERAISDLRNTIENLIVERDALKAASDATRSNGKKWLAVMRRQ